MYVCLVCSAELIQGRLYCWVSSELYPKIPNNIFCCFDFVLTFSDSLIMQKGWPQTCGALLPSEFQAMGIQVFATIPNSKIVFLNIPLKPFQLSQKHVVNISNIFLQAGQSAQGRQRVSHYTVLLKKATWLHTDKNYGLI